jgi:hypothetical protein
MDDVDMLIFIATRQHNLLHGTPSTISFAAVCVGCIDPLESFHGSPLGFGWQH